MAQSSTVQPTSRTVAEAAVQLVVMARLTLEAHGGKIRRAGVPNASDLGVIGPLAEWPATESWRPRGGPSQEPCGIDK